MKEQYIDLTAEILDLEEIHFGLEEEALYRKDYEELKQTNIPKKSLKPTHKHESELLPFLIALLISTIFTLALILDTIIVIFNKSF